MILTPVVDDVFICPSCETNRSVFKSGHKPSHGLVLCQQQHNEVANEYLYSRLNSFGADFSALDSKVDALRGRMDVLDTRMQNIETMLSVLLKKIT